MAVRIKRQGDGAVTARLWAIFGWTPLVKSLLQIRGFLIGWLSGAAGRWVGVGLAGSVEGAVIELAHPAAPRHDPVGKLCTRPRNYDLVHQ